MTEQLRIRMDRELVKSATQVCAELGITPKEAISMFFAQLVRLRGLPFRPSAFPVLDEYGVTRDQAEKAVCAAKKEIKRDRKAGKLIEFKGKIPV